MSRLAWLKLAEYEYEVVYKAEKINTDVNADALSRNPILVFLLKASGKTDSKEPALLKSPRNKILESGTATDSGPKKTQPDINTQPTKTNTNTENKRNEFPWENVDNDMEIQAVSPRSSFMEGPQEIDTQNNSDS